MKKNEIIALVCGLLAVAAIVTWLSYSGRVTKAENEARNAQELVEVMQQREADRIERANQSMIQAQADLTPAPTPNNSPRVPSLPLIDLKHLATDSRPISGTLLLNRLGKDTVFKGYGELTITNGLVEDAFVKVVQGDRLMAAMYVRGNSSFAIDRIPDGSYTILYKTGFGWNEEDRDFNRGRGASKFDDDLVYSTRTMNDGKTIQSFYDTMTLTLHKVADGNAPAEDISDAEFNKYKE